jgi:predicted dehydrogenase
MGTNHARVASTLQHAQLTHVVDVDPERAESLAAAVDATALTDPFELIGKVDAAVIALPTNLHTSVAVPLLESGVHCLVEKPIAGTLEEAEATVAAARSGGSVLMVGHVERFNPAVLQLDGILEDVIHVEATRVGPFSARVRDSIVIDLMIHDLDLVRMIAGSEVKDLVAVAQRHRTDTEDLASALLRFDNGVTANLTASRLGQQKTRELRITQADSFVNVDLMRVDVTINRVQHAEFTGPEGTRYRQTGVVEIPMIEARGEPLWLEQREFVNAIVEQRPPRVTGEDGLRALALALQVIDTCRAGR